MVPVIQRTRHVEDEVAAKVLADTDKWRNEFLLNNQSGFAMLMFTFEDAIRHILGGDSYRDEAFCFGLPHS